MGHSRQFHLRWLSAYQKPKPVSKYNHPSSFRFEESKLRILDEINNLREDQSNEMITRGKQEHPSRLLEQQKGTAINQMSVCTPVYKERQACLFVVCSRPLKWWPSNVLWSHLTISTGNCVGLQAYGLYCISLQQGKALAHVSSLVE